MTLVQLVSENTLVEKWAVYDYRNEHIAFTSRNILLSLCRDNTKFRKHIDVILCNDSGFIKVRLSSR